MKSCAEYSVKSSASVNSVPETTSTGWPSAMQFLPPRKSLTRCAVFWMPSTLLFLASAAAPLPTLAMPFMYAAFAFFSNFDHMI